MGLRASPVRPIRHAGRPNIVYVMADDCGTTRWTVADLKTGWWLRLDAPPRDDVLEDVDERQSVLSSRDCLTGQTAFNTKVFGNQTYKDLENTLPCGCRRRAAAPVHGQVPQRVPAQRPRPRGGRTGSRWSSTSSWNTATMLNRKGRSSRATSSPTALRDQPRASQGLPRRQEAGVRHYWPFAPTSGRTRSQTADVKSRGHRRTRVSTRPISATSPDGCSRGSRHRERTPSSGMRTGRRCACGRCSASTTG